MPRLLPCSSCGRHVQLGTGQCPFCGQVGLTTSASSPGVLSTLLLGLSLMGCDGGKDAPRPADKYGAPPPTDRDEQKEADDGSKAEPTPAEPRPETKYGGPPGLEVTPPSAPPPAADDGAKAEPVPDDPRAADKYGAPPPRDDEPVKPEPAP